LISVIKDTDFDDGDRTFNVEQMSSARVWGKPQHMLVELRSGQSPAEHGCGRGMRHDVGAA